MYPSFIFITPGQYTPNNENSIKNSQYTISNSNNDPQNIYTSNFRTNVANRLNNTNSYQTLSNTNTNILNTNKTQNASPNFLTLPSQSVQLQSQSQHCINPCLTVLGKKQCQKLKTYLKLSHIDTVLVSPLERALETCEIIFGGEEGIEIWVEPLLCERLQNVKNLPINAGKEGRVNESEIKNTEYSNYRWEKIGSEKGKEGLGRWYVDYVVGESKRQNLIQKGEQIGIDKAIIESVKIGIVESLKQFKERVEKLKIQLIRYKQLAKKKIAIVTHPQMIEMITATGFYQNGQPINYVRIQDGRVKQVPIIIDGFHFQDENLVPFCKLP